MKKLIPAFILMFSFCFMFFIYEPITMYATNINDFWFDLGIMIKPVLIIFASFLLGGWVIAVFLYVLSHKLLKKPKLYYLFFLLVAIVFLATYIQGNYLIGHLPALDGSTINWNIYTKDNFVTLVIWIITSLIAILMVKKLSIEKTTKILSYVSLAVFFMLSTSLISTLTSNDAFITKNASYVTDANFNTISKNNNFLIFLVDAIDEDTFYKVWQENEEYKDLFDDFTYYSDALSTYPFTRDSIPYILTGIWNKNETDFGTYSSNAYNNSALFQNLTEKKYDINLYEEELVWNGNRNFEITNITSSQNANVDMFMFFKQEMKYVLFKYLPYNLKRFSRIEYMNFGLTVDKYRWNEDIVYKNMVDNPNLKKVSTNQFQFIHAEGGHVPFDYDKNVNKISNGTYEQKIEASITLIKTYIERLKKNKTYDNSVIIIMADHGYGGDTIMGRFNPLLMIKGLNEKHDVIVNDVKISYEDLQSVFVDLLNGKKSTDLLQDVEEDTKRTFIWYAYEYEDHMVEYNTTGTAKEENKFKETGNVYDR